MYSISKMSDSTSEKNTLKNDKTIIKKYKQKCPFLSFLMEFFTKGRNFQFSRNRFKSINLEEVMFDLIIFDVFVSTS